MSERDEWGQSEKFDTEEDAVTRFVSDKPDEAVKLIMRYEDRITGVERQLAELQGAFASASGVTGDLLSYEELAREYFKLLDAQQPAVTGNGLSLSINQPGQIGYQPAVTDEQLDNVWRLYVGMAEPFMSEYDKQRERARIRAALEQGESGDS